MRRLRAERCLGVWYSGGLESDGVEGGSVGRDGHRGGVAFNIPGDWKATALKAGVWVETGIEGGWCLI